jgi:Zn-dependent protease
MSGSPRSLARRRWPNMADLSYQISIWILPVLFAVTFHEASHGFVAWRLGDDTAKRLGRVTFNPLRHIDPFGTVILPAMLLLASGGRMMFGFAKPVPVNFARLRRPRRDMVLVAAAGPGINMAMALTAALLLARIPAQPGDALEWIGYNLFNAVWINVLLAVFNMLPLPPLDGGRVAVGLLPDALARPLSRLEPFGFFIILGLLFVLPFLGDLLGVDIGIVQWLVVAPAEWLSRGIFTLVGAI